MQVRIYPYLFARIVRHFSVFFIKKRPCYRRALLIVHPPRRSFYASAASALPSDLQASSATASGASWQITASPAWHSYHRRSCQDRPHILIQALEEKTGTYIWNKANGIASSVVRTDHVEAKSYSNETTVAKDITESNYEERMPDILLALCDSVARRLHKDDVYGKTITFQVKTNDFHRHSRQISLADSTRDAGILYNTATRIADELLFGNHGLFAKGLGVRLVGVGVSGIDHGQYRQMNLFDLLEDPADVSHTAKDVPEIPLGQEQRSQALADMRNLLEHKYGRSVLKRASELKKSSDQSNLDRLKTKK